MKGGKSGPASNDHQCTLPAGTTSSPPDRNEGQPQLRGDELPAATISGLPHEHESQLQLRVGSDNNVFENRVVSIEKDEQKHEKVEDDLRTFENITFCADTAQHPGGLMPQTIPATPKLGRQTRTLPVASCSAVRPAGPPPPTPARAGHQNERPRTRARGVPPILLQEATNYLETKRKRRRVMEKSPSSCD